LDALETKDTWNLTCSWLEFHGSSAAIIKSGHLLFGVGPALLAFGDLLDVLPAHDTCLFPKFQTWEQFGHTNFGFLPPRICGPIFLLKIKQAEFQIDVILLVSAAPK